MATSIFNEIIFKSLNCFGAKSGFFMVFSLGPGILRAGVGPALGVPGLPRPGRLRPPRGFLAGRQRQQAYPTGTGSEPNPPPAAAPRGQDAQLRLRASGGVGGAGGVSGEFEVIY